MLRILYILCPHSENVHTGTRWEEPYAPCAGVVQRQMVAARRHWVEVPHGVVYHGDIAIL